MVKHKDNSDIAAGHRVIIKRAMRAAGIPDPASYTQEQLDSWARNNPREIAKSLALWFERAARAWVRGNNSGNCPMLSDGEAEMSRCHAQAESVLALMGIAADYPGLYPNFAHSGHSYDFGELRRCLDDACATHKVTRDGLELYRSTEAECFGWLQRHQPASVSHATTREGYSIEAVAVKAEVRAAQLAKKARRAK